MRPSRQIAPKGKRTYALVGDGECELFYLQMMQRYIRSKVGIALTLSLEPKLAQRKKLAEQYEAVKQLTNVYDKVFWIIDLDVVNAQNKLAEFEKYYEEIVAENLIQKSKKEEERIVLIINSPCLEFWLLLHFKPTSGHYNNCEEAGKQLKQVLSGYEKSEKYYLKQGNDIFVKLKPKLHEAIKHTEKTKFDFDSPRAGVSEMHKLFNDEHIKKIMDSI